MRGMSKAKFEQEFNINYAAHQGEKAFPEMMARRAEIICREGPFVDGVFPSSLPMWAGFDYGARNPSSFHVYTVVDGITYAIWEMYGPCRNLIEYVSTLKQCPYWDQIKYIVYDPDMDNLKQRDMKSGDVASVYAQFVSLGVTRLLKGRNDEPAWMSMMHKHWCGPEITFKILECCPMMIDEFEMATYVTMSDKQLETQNYRESLVDRHNHSLDDCKYFMNSAVVRAAGPKRTQPNLAAAYGWSGGGQSNRSYGRYGEII